MNILKSYLNKKNLYIMNDLNLKMRDVLRFCVDLLVKDSKIKIDQKIELLEEFKEREQKSSMAIGEGIAIPHIKTGIVKKSFVVLVFVPHGIKGGSIDGKDVNLVFFSVVPKNEMIFSLTLNSSFIKFVQKLNLKKIIENKEHYSEILLEKLAEFDS